MKEEKLSKGDKALIAIFELNNQKKNDGKITVEDVAVQLWKTYPSEFCMRGYPQFPNVDIQKYITKLLDNNLIEGGVYNYKLTDKGKLHAQRLMPQRGKEKIGIKESVEPPRNVKSEINRILGSKVFQYYSETHGIDFVDSDFFEFLGTSSRSLTTHDKNIFLAKYNMIVKDIIPFCEKHKNNDEQARKIIELWNLLSEKFKELIERKIK